MHAYLIVGDKISVDKKVKELAQETGNKLIEFPFAKVGDLKELNSFIKLTLQEKTAILLNNFDKATNETQNAFLKSLEEPQERLIYILTAQNPHGILPTIISRCQTIQVNSMSSVLDGNEKEKVENFISSNTGEKLNIISKINKRDEAIEFTNNLIIISHKLMLKDSRVVNISNEALKLKKNLEANGNVQLQLTNFVVNIN